MSVVSDIVSGVGDAIGSVVSGIGDVVSNVVQGIGDNPLKAAAMIAAAYFTGGASLAVDGVAAADATAFEMAAADATAAGVETFPYVDLAAPAAESGTSSALGAISIPADSMAGGYTGLVRDAAGNITGGFTGSNAAYAADTSFINGTGYAIGDTSGAFSIADTLRVANQAKNVVQLVNPTTRQRSSIAAGQQIPAGWAVDGRYTNQNPTFGGNMETPQGTPNPGAAPQNVMPNAQPGSMSPLVMLLAGAVVMYFASRGK